MASFNKVILAGNLTRDPELRYTPKGVACLSFSLAINRSWTSESGEKKEDVTFVECTAFQRRAEVIGQYLKKGDPLLIEGRLRTESWDDKTTGQKRSKLSVLCESFSFIGAKREASEGDDRRGAATAGAARPYQKGKPPAGKAEPSDNDGGPPPGDDDVPF